MLLLMTMLIRMASAQEVDENEEIIQRLHYGLTYIKSRKEFTLVSGYWTHTICYRIPRVERFQPKLRGSLTNNSLFSALVENAFQAFKLDYDTRMVEIKRVFPSLEEKTPNNYRRALLDLSGFLKQIVGTPSSQDMKPRNQ